MFRSSSLPPEVEHRNNTEGHPAASQTLAVPASVPARRAHSSYSETPSIQTHGPALHDPSSLAAGSNVTVVSLGDCGSPSPADVHDSSSASVMAPIDHVPYSEPFASGNPAPPSTCPSHMPTPPTIQVQAVTTTDVHAAVLPQTEPTPGPDVILPSPHSSTVWAEALRIAEKKLGHNNLPLNLTNFTTQSAEENIEAVVKGLITLQEDDRKKRWRYTRNGKEVIIVERLGKIFKTVEKYSKVTTAFQSNQVTALVWAGICGIIQVRIWCTLMGGYQLIPWAGHVKPCRSNRRF